MEEIHGAVEEARRFYHLSVSFFCKVLRGDIVLWLAGVFVSCRKYFPFWRQTERNCVNFYIKFLGTILYNKRRAMDVSSLWQIPLHLGTSLMFPKMLCVGFI